MIIKQLVASRNNTGFLTTIYTGKIAKSRNLMISSFKGVGGGVHPVYFVKLDFEIAVDQQTRARDRTFEGVPDSG